MAAAGGLLPGDTLPPRRGCAEQGRGAVRFNIFYSLKTPKSRNDRGAVGEGGDALEPAPRGPRCHGNRAPAPPRRHRKWAGPPARPPPQNAPRARSRPPPAPSGAGTQAGPGRDGRLLLLLLGRRGQRQLGDGIRLQRLGPGAAAQSPLHLPQGSRRDAGRWLRKIPLRVRLQLPGRVYAEASEARSTSRTDGKTRRAGGGAGGGRVEVQAHRAAAGLHSLLGLSAARGGRQQALPQAVSRGARSCRQRDRVFLGGFLGSCRRRSPPWSCQSGGTTGLWKSAGVQAGRARVVQLKKKRGGFHRLGLNSALRFPGGCWKGRARGGCEESVLAARASPLQSSRAEPCQKHSSPSPSSGELTG